MNKLLLFLKYIFFFITGGFAYYSIEMLYRGYSHYSMFILGGVCFILIGLLNEVWSWETYIEKQIGAGLLIVLILEFIAGFILNIWLKLNVWDYSNLPLNILGQICLPFALLWVPIIFVAIILDDFIRYKLFNEEKPRYVSYIINKIKNEKLY